MAEDAAWLALQGARLDASVDATAAAVGSAGVAAGSSTMAALDTASKSDAVPLTASSAYASAVAGALSTASEGCVAMSLRELAARAASAAMVAWSRAARSCLSFSSLAESIVRLDICSEPHEVHFVRRTWSSWPHMLHARIQLLRSESGERAR